MLNELSSFLLPLRELVLFKHTDLLKKIHGINMKFYRRNLCLIICIILSACQSHGSKNKADKPNNITNFNKVTVINGTWYGLTHHRSPSGVFDKFTISTSTDSVTWSEPTVVLSKDDLASKGTDQHEDYTQSKLASVKWVKCPATGNMSIWAKRHGIDENGNVVPRKELLRAAVLGSGKTPTDSYTDSIIIDLPYGNASGDLGEIVEDGIPYLASADTEQGIIHIFELNDQCSDLKPDGPLQSLQWFNDDSTVDHREAPAIFQENNHVFLLTSGKTGWRPNQHKYAYAPSVRGPWSKELILIGDSTAYHSQVFGVKRIRSSNGSGHSSLLFSGTRNAALWNGTDSRDIWMPMYFNTDTDLATNYYDKIRIDEKQGTVEGYHLDHGTRLPIKNLQLESGQDDLSALIDNDLSTFWYNQNDQNRSSVIFDLGDTQLIKAIKLKHFDQYNGKIDVSLRTPRLKVEVGDGQVFTTVFEDIVGSINWLQTVNLPETSGQFLKLSLVENHKGNSSGTTDDFGFYEIEIWGNQAEQSPQLLADFEHNPSGELPPGWQISESAGTSASIINQSGNRVLQLEDQHSNGRVSVSHQFIEQKGANVQVALRFNLSRLGAGEYIRLMSGSKMLINIVNSEKHKTLAITDAKFKETSIAPINSNQWYELRLAINTDANTFDVFLDNRLIWGGAQFAQQGDFLDSIRVGTATKQAVSKILFDDIRVHGPITKY